MTISETIIPWLLGTLLLLALLTFGITIKSWREMKRSPYFFMRRQAEKRMQTYSQASLVLILATAVTSGYSWQKPPDTTPRVAILANAKPPSEQIVALINEKTVTAVDQAAVVELVGSEQLSLFGPDATLDLVADLLNQEQQDSTLPEEYSQFEAVSELNSFTKIGDLFFSTEISPGYEAVNPQRLFPEGFFTLYATFAYADMENGMEWSWVWKHNGSVIDGGNELWAYGQDGPGFIYLNPEEGFQNGEYALEVWVNGEMLSQSSVNMNTAAFNARN